MHKGAGNCLVPLAHQAMCARESHRNAAIPRKTVSEEENSQPCIEFNMLHTFHSKIWTNLCQTSQLKKTRVPPRWTTGRVHLWSKSIQLSSKSIASPRKITARYCILRSKRPRWPIPKAFKQPKATTTGSCQICDEFGQDFKLVLHTEKFQENSFEH